MAILARPKLLQPGQEENVLERFVGSGLKLEADPEDEKIIFRKPPKRSAEENYFGLTVTSNKKIKAIKKNSLNFQNSAKQVKNKSLLSFDAEESDD